MSNAIEQAAKDYWEAKPKDAKIERLEFEPIVAWVKEGSKVLDLGCGDGTLGKLLIDKGCDVYGLDISSEAVRRAKAKGIKAQKYNIDTPLPFEEDSFDIVVACDVFEHVYFPHKLLSECRRTAPRLIIASPNVAYFKARFQLLFGGRFPKSPLFDDNWYDTLHIRLFSYKDFLDLASKYGMRKSRADFCTSKLPKALIRLIPNLLARVFILELVREGKSNDPIKR